MCKNYYRKTDEAATLNMMPLSKDNAALEFTNLI